MARISQIDKENLDEQFSRFTSTITNCTWSDACLQFHEIDASKFPQLSILIKGLIVKTSDNSISSHTQSSTSGSDSLYNAPLTHIVCKSQIISDKTRNNVIDELDCTKAGGKIPRWVDIGRDVDCFDRKKFVDSYEFLKWCHENRKLTMRWLLNELNSNGMDNMAKQIEQDWRRNSYC